MTPPQLIERWESRFNQTQLTLNWRSVWILEMYNETCVHVVLWDIFNRKYIREKLVRRELRNVDDLVLKQVVNDPRTQTKNKCCSKYVLPTGNVRLLEL